MMIITATALIIAGIFTAISEVKKNHASIAFVATFLLGISTLILSKEYFTAESGTNPTLPLLLIAVLSVSFALGEFLKNKKYIILFVIPAILSGLFLFYPQLDKHSYLNHSIDDVYILVLVGLIAALAPILIHAANLLIKKVVNSLSPIEWSTKDAALLHGAFSFLFIGIAAALGNFLLGTLGILVMAVFFLASTFLIRDKSTVSSSTLLSASGALFIISAAFLILEQAGFTALDLTKGEVFQGLF